MRKIFSFIILLNLYGFVFGQNHKDLKPLDKEAFESWPSVTEANISNNGAYVVYTIFNQPKGQSTLIIATNDGIKKKEFLNAKTSLFSSDSKTLYIKSSADDTLFILNLIDFSQKSISDVSAFDLVENSFGNWLVYHNVNQRRLTIVNLRNREHVFLDNIVGYRMGSSSSILIERKHKSDVNDIVNYRLNTGKQSFICKGEKLLNVADTKNGDYLALITKLENDDTKKIYLFNKNNDSVQEVVTDGEEKLMRCHISDDPMQFNLSGTALLFNVKDVSDRPKSRTDSGVNIWSYTDSFIKSEELVNAYDHVNRKRFCFAYCIKEQNLIQLDYNEDRSVFIQKTTNNYALFPGKEDSHSYYKRESLPYLHVIDLNSGKRIEILKKGQTDFGTAVISPDERFIVWFDNDNLSWQSYSFETKRIKNISAADSYPVYDEIGLERGRKASWGIAGWMPNDDSVLIYDQYDIWKVDLKGEILPTNLTLGFGRKSGITLKMLHDNPEAYSLKLKDHVLISGYSRESKKGGYWYVPLRNPDFPLKNINDYSVSTRMPVGYFGFASGKILASKGNKGFLVIREKAETSPNVYFTKDLTNYVNISKNHPEKNYNWLTAELVTWKMFDGKLSQGIFYKPGNFNKEKKYPLILNYYESRSDEFHEFIKPGFSTSNINIPSFVDKGYLVFVPDVHSMPGQNGKGTYNSIVSAAEHLSKIDYVDSTRVGIQGHSYGGWQTNYLITHSKRFAAACEASGVSNQVSGYGQVAYVKGNSRQKLYEVLSQGSPYGIGITPWTHPSLYIDNSPVFTIGAVTTPLLMMHNKEDDAVPFAQAIEFYTGLVRAGKKVWLLQYDNSGHTLSGKNAEDYHNRMMEFFDHYLKGTPLPVWMDKQHELETIQ